MPEVPAHDAQALRQPSALYVHVPFCLHHCGYCDFTLVARRDHLIPEYLRLLSREFEAFDVGEAKNGESGEQSVRRSCVDTIFIGGGTPTHLSPQNLQTLFDLVGRYFSLTRDGEFSIEANPDGLCQQRLEILDSNGVNRLSLGVQSFDDDVLKTLERTHTSTEAKVAVRQAAAIVPNLSVDLIFGVPGQTMESWIVTLKEVLQLPVRHISTYGLTYEQGTPFFRREKIGDLRRIPDSLERDMYLVGIDLLQQAGFEHYEVSNFSLPGSQCRHNNVYWNADEYFAFGPGAARYVNGVRSTNCRSVVKWMSSWRTNTPCIEEREELSPEERAREAVMLALRRMKGLHLPSFEARFGLTLNSLAADALQHHLEDGLLIKEGDFLRLTRKGLVIADSVVCDFL